MVTAADIQQARLDLKESQEVFAARFGVDQSTIHRWESSGIPVRGAAAMAVERVLAGLPTPNEASS